VKFASANELGRSSVINERLCVVGLGEQARGLSECAIVERAFGKREEMELERSVVGFAGGWCDHGAAVRGLRSSGRRAACFEHGFTSARASWSSSSRRCRSSAYSSQSSSSTPSAAGAAAAATVVKMGAVGIERPKRDVRVVTSSIRVSAPLEVVWGVLSAYEELDDVVPNLAVSRKRYHPNGGIRLEQCGVQSILGFQFSASVVMDMTEHVDTDKLRRISFRMVDSRDFKQFEGVWRMESITPRATRLSYSVTISPRGLVPVAAVEWRIKEDVPANLEALRTACEKVQLEQYAQLQVKRA